LSGGRTSGEKINILQHLHRYSVEKEAMFEGAGGSLKKVKSRTLEGDGKEESYLRKK